MGPEERSAAPAPGADAQAGPADEEAVLRDAKRFQHDFLAVREQIERVVVGHRSIVDGVLTCLFTGGHALLEGVPGLGKTLLIRTLAGALDLEFHRIQFTPDLMPADITGTTVVRESEGTRAFVFEPGPIFSQILLADEINRATPKTQAAMLEAMQERMVTAGGETRPLPRPFFVMATQNPVEQEGTYPLPEAQLDRFFFKLQVGYSTRDQLAEILRRTTAGEEARADAVIDAERIIAHQRLVRRVAIADHVSDYAVRMVLATHPGGDFAPPQVSKYVRLGASPRAAQALVLAGKCRALVAGRAAVSTDDVKQVSAPALRHRILLNFEGQAEGLTTDDVVRTIADTLPVQAPTRAA